MNTRKKTPKAISEQLKRIVRYLMIRSWKDGQPSSKERDKVLKVCGAIHLTAWRYISNIYKQAGVDMNCASASESNEVWNNYQASREEYTPTTSMEGQEV